jgi:hypothetical protein
LRAFSEVVVSTAPKGACALSAVVFVGSQEEYLGLSFVSGVAKNETNPTSEAE